MCDYMHKDIYMCATLNCLTYLYNCHLTKTNPVVIYISKYKLYSTIALNGFYQKDSEP